MYQRRTCSMAFKLMTVFLLCIGYANGNYCIFDVENGSPSGECKLSNGAAVGIIVVIVVVVLFIALMIACAYCRKSFREGAGAAANQGINLCTHNCHCCGRHVPSQTIDPGQIYEMSGNAVPDPPPYSVK